MHPATISSPGIQCTVASLHLSKRKRDSSIQATFFHCSTAQFWQSHACGWHYWQWTGVIICTLTGLHSPIRRQIMMRCVLWHLLVMASIFQQFTPAAPLCDWTRWSSLHASVSLGCPWPWRRFTGCPSLHYAWSVLTTAYQDTMRLGILEMLWPSRLAITIWPLSDSLRRFLLPIFLASNIWLFTRWLILYPTPEISIRNTLTAALTSFFVIWCKGNTILIIVL